MPFDLKARILQSINYLEYYSRYINGLKSAGKDEYKGFCCFHDDKNHESFTCNTSNGLWQCKAGCAEGDVFHFVAKIYGLDVKNDFKKVLEQLAYDLGIPGIESDLKPSITPSNRPIKSKKQNLEEIRSSKPIPESINEEFRKNLTTELLNDLAQLRGLLPETIKSFEIGYDLRTKRYTIPVRDSKGNIRNFRMYSPDAKRGKMKNYYKKTGKTIIKYHNKSHIFPLNRFLEHNPEFVIFCEGEFDCITLWEKGIPALTCLSGVSTWSETWYRYFQNKKFIFIFDYEVSDDPKEHEKSYKIAQKRAEQLLKSNVCDEVQVVKLPVKGDKNDKDITDWFRSGKTIDDLHEVIKKTFVLKKNAKKEDKKSEAVTTDGNKSSKDPQKPKKPRKISVPEMADRFLGSDYCKNGHGILLRRWRKDYWKFVGTHFRKVEYERIEAKVLNFIRRKIGRNEAIIYNSNNLLANLNHYILLAKDIDAPMTNLGKEWPDHLKGFVSMKNGIIDLDHFLRDNTYSLGKHTPEIFFIHSLPYEFNPIADCPKWLKFLGEVIPSEPVRTLLQEYAGYMLATHLDINFQKFLMCIGEGRNGKSVFLDVMRAMLGGKENVSSVSITEFGDKFKIASMVNKIANISGEAGEVEKVYEERLKAIVGGDEIEVEEKYKPSYSTRLPSKLIFAANSFPRFKDKTSGLWEKMMIIGFNVYIPPEKRIANLSDDIIETDISGVFNWAIRGLKRLTERGRFEEPEECLMLREDFSTEMNSAKRFMKDYYEIKVGSVVVCQSVYYKYKTWCIDRGLRPMGDSQFGKEVLAMYKGNVAKTRPRIDGARAQCYFNLESIDYEDATGDSYLE